MFRIDFGRQVDIMLIIILSMGDFCHLADFPPMFNKKIKVPNNIQQMVQLAELLFAGFTFLRIDLYNNGDIKSGEITLYPTSGMGRFTKKEWDMILGDI